MEQPHLEVNQDGLEEEECYNRINFREGDPRELRNSRPHCPGGLEEDVGDLSRIIAKLDRRCKNMEMEMKDKRKSLVVDRLLSGTNSPFTS
jgi:hypothetical protein